MNWKLLLAMGIIAAVGIALVLFTPIGLLLLPISAVIMPYIMPWLTPFLNLISGFIQQGQNIPYIGGILGALSAVGGLVATYVRTRFNALKEQNTQQISQVKMQASDTAIAIQKDYEQKLTEQVTAVKTQATEQLSALQEKANTFESQLTQKQKEVDEANTRANEAERILNSFMNVTCRNCQKPYPKAMTACPYCNTLQVPVP